MKIPYFPCLLALVMFMFAALCFFCACFFITQGNTGGTGYCFFLSLGSLAVGLYIFYEEEREADE